VLAHSNNVIGSCFGGVQEKTDDNIPMPTYFRFLALLGFKIFAAEQVCSHVLNFQEKLFRVHSIFCLFYLK